MDTNSLTRLKDSFDLIAHTDKDSEIEFWYARDIQKILGYSEWRNFFKIIDKAKESCSNTGVEIGSSISRPVEDIMLTRYACYLKNSRLPKI